MTLSRETAERLLLRAQNRHWQCDCRAPPEKPLGRHCSFPSQATTWRRTTARAGEARATPLRLAREALSECCFPYQRRRGGQSRWESERDLDRVLGVQRCVGRSSGAQRAARNADAARQRARRSSRIGLAPSSSRRCSASGCSASSAAINAPGDRSSSAAALTAELRTHSAPLGRCLVRAAIRWGFRRMALFATWTASMSSAWSTSFHVAASPAANWGKLDVRERPDAPFDRRAPKTAMAAGTNRDRMRGGGSVIETSAGGTAAGTSALSSVSD